MRTTRAIGILGGICVIGLTAVAVIAGSANGEPILVSPPDGAVLTSGHPVLYWELPQHERADAITVARAPWTTPEGRFYDEYVVRYEAFIGEVRVWSPASALFAGKYWWTVRSVDRQTLVPSYNWPVSFIIGAQGRLVAIRSQSRSYSHRSGKLEISVRWLANAREPMLIASLSHRGHRIWRQRERKTAREAAAAHRTEFNWERPRKIRRGSRLMLTITLAFGGPTFGGPTQTTMRRWVRAP